MNRRGESFADYYELLERFSIMTVDGNLSDREAMEYCSKYAPPELMAELRDTKPTEKTNTPDFDTLHQYIEMGFTLYSQKQKGQGRFFIDWKTTKSAKKHEAAIVNGEELKTAINNGVKLFAFLPSEKNYFCFDIDSGHANGVDGLQVFADYFKQKGIEYNFFNPDAIYTQTPRGGRHLYFKDWTNTPKYLTEPFNNVEVMARGNSKTLTAAGSIKNETLYKLHGFLKDAPNLPNMLIKHITPAPKPQYKKDFGQKQASYELSEIIDSVIQKKSGCGRNNTAWAIGFRIGQQYSFEKVFADCIGRAIFADFPESELRQAINNGIKASKY